MHITFEQLILIVFTGFIFFAIGTLITGCYKVQQKRINGERAYRRLER